VAISLDPCRKFKCKNPVDPANPDICAELVKNSETDWVEYVGSCGIFSIDTYLERGKTCRMNEVGERNLRCSENPEFYKHPGQKCATGGLCLGHVEGGFCRGKKLGEECKDHLECDVGLRCGGDYKCEEASLEGEYCDLDFKLCQSYLYCKEGECIRYGTIPNGHPPGDGGVDLCESHYLNKHDVCEEGPVLKGEVFVNSNEDLCAYSNGEENKAVCGYHEDGKAICKPGAGTLLSEWNELLEYLKRKPRCHPMIGILGQCDYGINVGERVYLKGRLAYAHLHWFTAIQKNPPCVQKFNYPEYFELLNQHNSGATLSVFFATLLALFFVLL